MAELFSPQAVSGALAMRDEAAEARATIAECRAIIRECLAARAGLEHAIEQAQEHEARAHEQLDKVGPAQERARQAKAADAADREQRAKAGTFGSDRKLADALERAEREAREAERDADAAHEALPAIAQTVQDARSALASNAERLDSAVWRLHMARLAVELPEVREAAAVVAAFQRRIRVLSDVGLRHKLYAVPGGSIPAEVQEAATLPKLAVDDLRADIRTECENLKRLRIDPDAR